MSTFNGSFELCITDTAPVQLFPLYAGITLSFKPVMVFKNVLLP